MKRSGNFSAKKWTMVDSARSPTSTTMRGSLSPSATSARSKPSRVFFISTFSGSVIVAVIVRDRPFGFRPMVRAANSVLEQSLGPLGVAGAQLLQPLLALLGLGGLAVPAIVVCHVADAVAHDGVREQQARD